MFCVSPEQVGVCADADDGTACTFDNDLAGTCYGDDERACLPAACGNARLDANEACDLGDTLPGNGCSAACDSDETCGNGIIDLATETCDDGDAQDHDGCSSSCAVELPRWQHDALQPGPRRGVSVAYHVGRRRGVLFGGFAPVLAAGDTWDWNGVRWHTVLGFGPAARHGQAMAYDHARREIVMFGGDTGSVANDTWTWSGVWRPASPQAAPIARRGHAMVYDGAREVTVMFGGAAPASSGVTRLDDTWEWNGATWTQTVPLGNRPVPRAQHAMAYDPIRSRVVMFGGETGPGGGGLRGDTWEYDGTSWTEVLPSTVPLPRFASAMAFDPISRRVVMVGGTDALGNALPDAWEWDGQNWTSVPAPPAGPVFLTPAMFDDPERGLVLVGAGETWVRVGGGWARLAPGADAPARSNQAGALDRARRVAVMFGGVANGGVRINDTWLWRGEWVNVVAASPPSGRRDSALAHDEQRDEMILYGGDTAAGASDETWRFRLTGETSGVWEEITGLAQTPGALRGHAMVYDRARAQILLFGGRIGIEPNEGTWSWNGSAWTQVIPSSSPPRRFGASMAYDPIRNTVVMFGGSAGGSVVLADLWEWDGDWHDITPPLSPSARSGSGLAWDAARGRLVLVGGNLSDSQRADDVWELERRPDGSARWIVTQVAEPLSRSNHLLVTALDAGGGVTVIQGSDGAATADVSTLRWDGSPAIETCTQDDSDADAVVGCADQDCWVSCTPTCEPGTTCDPQAPRCGDGTCSRIEDCAICPGDCGACPMVCGDFACAGETATTCPGDCP